MPPIARNIRIAPWWPPLRIGLGGDDSTPDRPGCQGPATEADCVELDLF